MLQRFINRVPDMTGEILAPEGYKISNTHRNTLLEIHSYSFNLYGLTRILQDGLKLVGSRA